MTFDGQHPCSMCIALEETRKKEKDDPTPRPERSTERHELFPQQDIRPKNRRVIVTANSPPSLGHLLGHCRFVSKRPTPATPVRLTEQGPLARQSLQLRWFLSLNTPSLVLLHEPPKVRPFRLPIALPPFRRSRAAS